MDVIREECKSVEETIQQISGKLVRFEDVLINDSLNKNGLEHNNLTNSVPIESFTWKNSFDLTTQKYF